MIVIDIRKKKEEPVKKILFRRSCSEDPVKKILQFTGLGKILMKSCSSTPQEPSSGPGVFCCCWLALVLLLTLVFPLAVVSFGLSLVRGPACVRVHWPGLSCIYLVCLCVLAWTVMYIFWCVRVCVDWTFLSWFVPNWGQLWYIYIF